MLSKTLLHSRPVALDARVSLAADQVLEIGGQRLRADKSKAYLEIYLAHAFPVRTIDGTSLHPQVVANSYASMMHQVFDLGHLMKAYNPEENQRDRILGAMVAVEFPATPMGGWTVQADKGSAPAIRAAAVIFKAAEGVAKILGEHQSGRRTWTVSMENEYYLQDSGFLIADGADLAGAEETPEDFKKLGFGYISALDAPEKLLDCFVPEESKVVKKWQGKEVTALLGGLAGSVHFKGVGATPVGKEKEAEISQVLASGMVVSEYRGDGVTGASASPTLRHSDTPTHAPDILRPLKELLAKMQSEDKEMAA